jgi:predicted acetyltransferase
MINIRAAHSDELDAMLALMCEAFNLPFTSAREVFYKDPYFNIEKKRVLLVNGKLTSCLTIADAPLRIGRAVIPVGGIAGVATDPSQRNRGYAGQLLVESLSALAAQGAALSALFPYRPDFYRRFGWEAAGSQFKAILSRDALPQYTEARYVRAGVPSDRADIVRLYEQWSQHRTGFRQRDEQRWDYILDHYKNRIVYKRGTVEGYLFYDFNEQGDGKRGIHIMEMVAGTEAAGRGFAGYIAQQKQIGVVSYTGGWEDIQSSGLLSGVVQKESQPLPVIQLQPGPMFRIIDFKRCLEALQPNFTGFKGEVTFCLNDKNVPGGPLTFTLEGDGSKTEVCIAEPGANARRRIEGDVLTWSAVAVGRYSLRDALSLHRLRATSEAAALLARPLFPRRQLFIPYLDHF